MAEDEAHLISPDKLFEKECFSVFDKLLSEMNNRSHIYHTISSDFSFLSGKSLSKNVRTLYVTFKSVQRTWVPHTAETLKLLNW